MFPAFHMLQKGKIVKDLFFYIQNQCKNIIMKDDTLTRLTDPKYINYPQWTTSQNILQYSMHKNEIPNGYYFMFVGVNAGCLNSTYKISTYFHFVHPLETIC